MLPVYRRLLKQGIRIMVYSGDVDAIVPGEAINQLSTLALVVRQYHGRGVHERKVLGRRGNDGGEA